MYLSTVLKYKVLKYRPSMGMASLKFVVKAVYPGHIKSLHPEDDYDVCKQVTKT